MNEAVTIIIIKDDEGHAPLIEKNDRAAGINNAIVAFTDGAGALSCESFSFALCNERQGLGPFS